MDEATKQRIAENEASFRAANELAHATDAERVAAAPPEARWDFICECGRSDCREPVRLTKAEYERVRSSPILFVVAPGHETQEVEDVVVERRDRFVVIEKAPGERSVAVGTDPRS